MLESTINDPSKDTFLRDIDLKGFGVRITPKGNIGFFAEGRIRQGRTKRIALGRYPVLEINEAREKARKVLYQLRSGVDPHVLERDKLALEAKQQALETARAVSLHYSLPVVIYFIVGSADYHESFSPPTPNKPRTIEDVRPIAKAMLNGIGFSDIRPVLEWHLYPSNDEWSVFLDAFKRWTGETPNEFRQMVR